AGEAKLPASIDPAIANRVLLFLECMCEGHYSDAQDFLRVEQAFLLPEDLKTIEVGDRVITSGADGVFPPGLLIGFVSQVTDAEAQVRPSVDFDQLSDVLVVDYPGVDINADLIAVGAVGFQTSNGEN
ncbi:MAG: rod shape-determining protein MreC, partial [Alphaproteobacteria bacterium]